MLSMWMVLLFSSSVPVIFTFLPSYCLAFSGQLAGT